MPRSGSVSRAASDETSAMLGPPLGLLVLGVLLGLLVFGARIPGVLAATLATDFTPREKKIIMVSLPRGMAAGVLATLPAAAGVPGTDSLPTVVFAAVFTTILVFAVGFPLVRRSLPPTLEQPETAAGPASLGQPTSDRSPPSLEHAGPVGAALSVEQLAVDPSGVTVPSLDPPVSAEVSQSVEAAAVPSPVDPKLPSDS